MMKALISFVFSTLLLPAWLYSHAFGNMAVLLPNVGAAFYDSPLLWHAKPWGLMPQWTIGAGLQKALDYRFWWVAETNVGFGTLATTSHEGLATVLAGAGLRYNFSETELRPHAGLQLHYLHFLGQAARKLPLNIDWPIWVGLRPSFGLEWIFSAEMSLVAEAHWAFYVNINEPFRQVLTCKVAYVLYF